MESLEHFACNHPNLLAIGMGIMFTMQDFSLSGATVGFENRGTDLAGEILTKSQIGIQECAGELALVADGSGSKFYSEEVVYDNDEPFDVDGSTCYDGYTSSATQSNAGEA